MPYSNFVCAGICCMFERELKERYPDKRELIYDVKELHAYIDEMSDINALVYAASCWI
jgi:hypothetical protein